MSEFGFIEWIRRRVQDRSPVLLGIGDDAAVLSPSSMPLLVTTDMLMEGTDFTFPETTPELAGRKSLAVNLSDIAAMGGVPTAAFVSVALPKSRGEEFAERFFTGLLDLAEEFGVILAGGDTNTWDQPLAANITLLGYPVGLAAITRSGAKPGDQIFVTGELGGSNHGHHLTFTPRIAEARQLVELVDLHAMIDISDGLAADLHHILKASKVGAVIDAAKIPLRFPSGGRESPGQVESRESRVESQQKTNPANSASLELNPWENAPRSEATQIHHALRDGEDFELLFTVSLADAQTLQQQWQGPTRLTCIGQITADRHCWLDIDGKRLPLPPLGWQHHLK